MASMNETSPGINVVSKAAAAVVAIAEGGELTAPELAERLGEPTSSVYRLLTNLERLGWLERGAQRGKVRIGLEFVWLADRLEQQLDVRRIASPELALLNELTGQTAFLCVRREARAVCIERIDGQDVQVQRLRLGESLALHEGAAPRAILAFEPDNFISDYLWRAFADEAERARMRGDLRDVRAAGVSVAHEEGASGIGSVGAPIFDQHGDVVAALSVSGMRHLLFGGRVDPEVLVIEAANRVSAALGCERHMTASDRVGDV